MSGNRLSSRIQAHDERVPTAGVLVHGTALHAMVQPVVMVMQRRFAAGAGFGGLMWLESLSLLAAQLIHERRRCKLQQSGVITTRCLYLSSQPTLSTLHSRPAPPVFYAEASRAIWWVRIRRRYSSAPSAAASILAVPSDCAAAPARPASAAPAAALHPLVPPRPAVSP